MGRISGESTVRPTVVKAAKTTKLEWPVPDAPQVSGVTSGDSNLTGQSGGRSSGLQLQAAGSAAADNMSLPIPPGGLSELDAADQAGLTSLRDALSNDPLALQQVADLVQTCTSAEQKGLWSGLASLVSRAPAAVTGLPTGTALVTQLVKDLAEPGSIYQGLATTTCTTASLQAILARTQPSEYVRLAGDLLISGKATLKDGSTIESKPVDFTVNEGRNPVSDALQEALLRRGLAEHAGSVGNDFGGRGKSAARASFAGTFRRASRSTIAGDNGGLTVDQFNALYKAVTGTSTVTISPSGMWDSLVKQDKNTLAAITVMLKPAQGSTSGHAVTLDSFDKQGKNWLVKYHDPEKPGPPQEMNLNNFKQMVDFVALPPSLASGSKEFLNNVARPARPASNTGIPSDIRKNPGDPAGMYRDMLGRPVDSRGKALTPEAISRAHLLLGSNSTRR